MFLTLRFSLIWSSVICNLKVIQELIVSFWNCLQFNVLISCSQKKPYLGGFIVVYVKLQIHMCQCLQRMHLCT
jgi:hypothetical protein